MSQAKTTHTISRRTAQLGGAAALTTAATTAPLAIKTQAAREALAAKPGLPLQPTMRGEPPMMHGTEPPAWRTKPKPSGAGP